MAKKYYSSQRSGMLSENKGNIANMPQEVMYKQYPSMMEGLEGSVYDSLEGIDGQMRKDHAGMKRRLSKRKY